MQLEQIYVYIANDYKNFKKYEQARIITNIQSEIILSGRKPTSSPTISCTS
ncbi:hypothetical protein [Faecalibacterium taiwanense]|uniref:hypothetical protein n=1 Tax=Faecalibacterium taiwanense TaxID=3030638 RepID=UPI00321A3B67